MTRAMRALAVGTALAASACSGNGAPAVPQGPASEPPPQQGTTTVTFSVMVPGGMHPHLASPSTQSVVVTLGTSTIATIDTSASSRACAAGKNAMRACSATAKTPSGNQTFAVSAYDGADGGGNLLASGDIVADLPAGKAMRVPIVLAGRPISLRVAFRNAHPPAGTAGEFALSVSALDADGNAILGLYGGTITLRDGDTSGATALSATSLTKSSQRVMLSYDGAPLSQAVVSASTAGAGTASAVFAPSPAIVAQYDAPPLKGFLPAGLSDLCIGPDGNIWGTAASSGGIMKIAPDGHFTTYKVLGTEPLGISSGSDGNLWFVEGTNAKVAKITTRGKITAYAIPVEPSGFSQPAWTTRGPDGRTWFLDQGSPPRAGAVTSGGTITMYPLPQNSFPEEIVTGPDGNLWITDDAFNGVLVMSPGGAIVAKHKMKTAGADPWGIAVGPDKNLWVAEYNVDKIARITPSGSVREFRVPTAVSGPLNVASGPDGNVWFTESGGSIGVAGKIGYVSTDGSVIRDFPMLGNIDHAHNLAFDAHANLWFTEFNGPYSALGKLVY